MGRGKLYKKYEYWMITPVHYPNKPDLLWKYNCKSNYDLQMLHPPFLLKARIYSLKHMPGDKLLFVLYKSNNRCILCLTLYSSYPLQRTSSSSLNKGHSRSTHKGWGSVTRAILTRRTHFWPLNNDILTLLGPYGLRRSPAPCSTWQVCKWLQGCKMH